MNLRQLFVENLEGARKAKGMTVGDLECRSGLSRTFVYLLRRGERDPTLKSLGALAKALGCTPAELISTKGCEDPTADRLLALYYPLRS